MGNIRDLIMTDKATAEEIFGSDSVLHSCGDLEQEHLFQVYDSIWIQALSVGVILVYLFVIYHYMSIAAAMMTHAFKLRYGNSVTAHNGGTGRKQSFMRLIIGLSVIFVPLFLLRLCSASIPGFLGENVESEELIKVYFLILGVQLAYILFEQAASLLLSWLTECRSLLSMLKEIKMSFYALFITIIIPFGIVYCVSSSMLSELGLIIIAAVFVVVVVLYMVLSFVVFARHGVSIFYWILYLCTMELVPASFVVAPLVR